MREMTLDVSLDDYFSTEWLGTHDAHLADVDALPMVGRECIYVMCLPNTPFSKVGVTANLFARQMQLAQPVMPIIRLALEVENRELALRVEAAAHHVLRKTRFEKEWFFASEAMATSAVLLAANRFGVPA